MTSRLGTGKRKPFFNSAKLFKKARRSERFPVFCLSICKEIAYKLKIHWKKVDIKVKDKRTSIVTVRDQYPTYACFPTNLVLSTLIKKKVKFSSYIRKFRMEQLQSHIWLTTFSYMGKYLYIPIILLGSPSSYMTLQLLHSEFPFIRGKFFFIFFCQCTDCTFKAGKTAAVSSKSFSRKSRENRFCFSDLFLGGKVCHVWWKKMAGSHVQMHQMVAIQ